MVRRLVAFAAVLVLLPSLALAQNQIAAGVKGGLNISNISENAEKVVSTNGIALGGFASRPVNERFFVQAEALFSAQGGKYGNTNLNINYLQFPVLAVAKFGESDIHPFLSGGLAFGFKVSASASAGNESRSVTTSNGDISLVLGGGVDFGKFSGEARYMIGFTDVDPGSDISKNRVISLLVGYRFR